jgi:hypothetical protein
MPRARASKLRRINRETSASTVGEVSIAKKY